MVNAAARSSFKWRYTVVTGYFPGVHVKLSKVIGIDHQACRVLSTYPRHRGYNVKDLPQFFIGRYDIPDLLVTLGYGLVYLGDEVLAGK